MNKIYKVIWSKVKHQYVVVSELAHSNGKQSRTSRNSIRSRIAALVVCGAIAAFGVFSALPTSSAFAAGAGAITKPGQYIAVAVDSNNNSYQSGWNTKPYHEGDTRTFQDAQGNTHNYTWVRVDNKDYWVREGYTITIENGSRFTAYDQSGHAIAPNNKYIIDSQKSSDADDTGLISSSEVVLSENVNRQTNSGKLVDVSAGIYGGAVNTGGTEVKSTYNYYINDNNSGWKDVGVKTTVSGMSNNFKQVYQLSNGTYNTNRYGTGTTVSTDNLYVIDGTLGAFFNSNGSVYTGNVYGHNNEVLMTGVDSVNGNYYSYWGTKVNDPNMSMSNMTLGDHDKIVAGLQTNIDHVNGDIVQEIKLDGNTAGQGGTINLERRGYWKGTEFVDTGSVDGGITISSEGGTGGKDVAIKFANEDGSFTVDAGSKVEGKTENGGNALTGLSINGEDYTIAAGGKSVTRSRVNDNGTITVYQGEDDQTGVTTENAIHDYALDSQERTASDGSVTLTGKDRYGTDTFNVKIDGLVTEDNLGEQIKTKNNLKVAEGDKGRWTITDASQDNKVFTNTTLADEVEKAGDKDSGYTYTVKDTANNTAVIDDVASATKLGEVNAQVNTNTTNIKNLGDRVTVNEGNITEIQGNMITGGQGNDDGTITLTGKNGDIATVNGLHDYAIDEQAVTVKDGSVSLKVTDRYDQNNTYDVTIDGIVTDDTVATKNNLKVEAGEKGRWTITDASQDNKVFENTTLTDAVEKAGDKDSGYTYTVKDTANNTAVIDDVASATKLGEVNAQVNTNTTNIKNLGDRVTVNEGNITEIQGNMITGGQGNDDGTITLTGAENKEIATVTGLHDYALKDQEKTASNGSVTLEGKDRYGADTFSVKINGLVTEDNLGEQIKTKNNLKVADGEKGRWTITDASQDNKVFENTTLTDAVEKAGDKDSGYTYTVKDTANNTAVIDDVASATKLGEVNKQVNTNTENIASLDGRVTVNEGDITDLGDRVTVNEGDITDLGDRVTVNEGDITDLGNRVTVNEGNITEIQGNMITGGQGNDDGTITLTGKNGDIATVNGLHDYAIDKQDVTVKDGSVSLKVTDRYDKNNTYDVTIDGIVTDDTVATKNNLKVEAGEKGRWTITDTSKEEGSQVFTNTTLADKVEKTGDKDSGYTYTVKDTAGNTAVIKDVASAEKLSSVDSKVGDTNYSSTNYIHNEDNLTTAASTLDSAIKATADKVDAGWALYSDGNKIKDVKPGDNWISVDAGENVSISKNENGNGLTISADLKDLDVEDTNAVLYDDDDKTTVTLAGTSGTRITNVAKGDISEKSTEAVNGSQLYATNQKVDAGWTATDGKTGITVSPTNNTLKFAGDDNITVTADDKNNAISVGLNDNITLGKGDNQININATGTDEENSSGKIVIGQGNKTVEINNSSITLNKSLVIDGSGVNGAIIHGLSNNNWDPKEKDNSTTAATEGQLYDVYDGSVKYWKKQDGTYDKSFIQLEGGEEGTTITHLKDGVVAEYSTEAINGSQLWETQQQIKDVETTANKHTIVSTTDDSNLTVKNVAKEGEADNYQVTLNDEVVLGDYFDKGNGVLISGNSGTISATNSITVGEDQGLVIDGQKKTIQGLSNITWTGTTETPNRAATEGQLQNAYDGSVKYWRNEDGTYDKSFIQLEGGEEGTTITHLKDGVVAEYSTEAINGSQLWETQQQIKDVETTANKHTIVSTTKDSNLTVKNVAGEGEADNYQVALKDDITLKGDNSSIELNGTKGTMQVNQETAEGTNFTNINGNVVSIGYTNSEGIENAIVIDGGKGTITGLSNTTWDDELAKQVADSEELQGTAATQGQLQQAVNEVAEVANAGWNAKAGGNTINVKPNETLNFEGDGNITVSATGGTSNELKFGLNDNITLGDKESTSITLYTDSTSETTVVGTDGNTTNVTGYVPESYKSGTGADFVKNNGGFALFTTDTQGHGIFGVTTKGTAHGKDFVTYTKDIYGNDTRYSLNDVGDAVAQMSSYYNGKNSYTVFSRYLNEAEKDNPFVTVDEDGNTINATRDIPLALRDDGAVLIGATIKGEDFTDNGIRINAETKTTYDKNGNEVTNNIATITGLENTEWKPPTPVATLAANDGSATVTSRAATESQLNDLYSAVAAYDVNVDGTIDYSHIALAGTPYGASRSGNGTPTGGTSITNVAYASGKDGSEAVNVDYLNDAINNAVKDGGAISDSDRHLQEGTYHVNDQGKVELIVADEKGENQSTVTIDNIANKNDITNLDNKIDNTFNDLNDKINNIDNVETDVKGGNINEDGTISLKTENEDGTTTNVTLKGQLTDSGVVQEGTTFDKETGTLTITSQDKYSGETSSVTVEGIASTEVVGATTKEDLATAYKDADKDGNATTEYITDSESMVEADVALDHAIQDVAGTSYANDMVLSNRIDSVEKRLGNVEERIDKVGAMAAAIANLRTMGFDPEAPTEIAIGVGQYKSETGIAIGVFHYPNQDFMLSASLSSSGDELMGGIGATWKLGRKSAAERAKDEEARHLEQAEEMKKLAQQEKVKAQAQRHAKLLAERQQASQKNA